MIITTFRINGYDLTNIASYTVSYEPMANNEVTSIDGTDYKDFIGFKRHITATLGARTDEQMNELIYALTEQTPARVTFYDTKQGGEITKDFYFSAQLDSQIKHWRQQFKWFGEITIQLREVGIC